MFVVKVNNIFFLSNAIKKACQQLSAGRLWFLGLGAVGLERLPVSGLKLLDKIAAEGVGKKLAALLEVAAAVGQVFDHRFHIGGEVEILMRFRVFPVRAQIETDLFAWPAQMPLFVAFPAGTADGRLELNELHCS